MPKLMRQADAAKKATEVLGLTEPISRQLVGMWITRGKLPVYNKFGVKLVALEDVIRLAKPVDTVNET